MTLLYGVDQHLLQFVQVHGFHDEDLVLLLQQLHVVQDHHAPGVPPVQLHRHRHLRAEPVLTL